MTCGSGGMICFF